LEISNELDENETNDLLEAIDHLVSNEDNDRQI